MKKGIKALIAMLLMAALLCTAASAATFPDVDANAEYATAIEYVSEIGLMVGYGDGTFQPDKTVSRAEMATVLCKMMGEDQDLKQDGSVFSDVPTTHWANGYVVKAASLGYLAGYGNGKFGPDDTVTYEQAVTMIVNATGGRNLASQYGGYPDGYVSLAEEYGLIEGVQAEIGDFFSRGQVAILLYNANGFRFEISLEDIVGTN